MKKPTGQRPMRFNGHVLPWQAWDYFQPTALKIFLCSRMFLAHFREVDLVCFEFAELATDSASSTQPERGYSSLPAEKVGLVRCRRTGTPRNLDALSRFGRIGCNTGPDRFQCVRRASWSRKNTSILSISALSPSHVGTDRAGKVIGVRDRDSQKNSPEPEPRSWSVSPTCGAPCPCCLQRPAPFGGFFFARWGA